MRRAPSKKFPSPNSQMGEAILQGGVRPLLRQLPAMESDFKSKPSLIAAQTWVKKPWGAVLAYLGSMPTRDRERALADLALSESERKHLLRTIKAMGSPSKIGTLAHHFKNAFPVASRPLRRELKIETLPDPDQLPDPGPLPDGSFLPFRRNDFFSGRSAILLEIARKLVFDKSGPPLGLVGGGGMGKTAIAIEFAYRYGRFFDAVFFVDCSNEFVLSNSLRKGFQVNSRDRAPKTNSEQIASARNFWQESGSFLLLFDNCQDWEQLRPLLPDKGSSRVLITSRNQKILEPAIPIELFSKEEGQQLVTRMAPHVSEEDGQEIGHLLGNHPLALANTANWLRLSGQKPQLFFKAMQSRSIFQHPALAQGNPSVVEILQQAFDRLDPSHAPDRDARQLLIAASCLAPMEAIPQDLLFTISPIEPENTNLAIDRLVSHGLLNHTESHYVIHLLTARFLWENLAIEELQEINLKVARLFLKKAQQINNTGLPAPLIPWQLHFRWLTDFWYASRNELGRSLCISLSVHQAEIGDFTAAEHNIRLGLELTEELYGKAHVETALCLNNLARFLEGKGRFKQAEELHRRNLALLEKLYGPSHPTIARSLSNLASVLSLTDRMEEAEALLLRAQEIIEEKQGSDHPLFALGLNNLGYFFKLRRQYEKAERYMRQALEIEQKISGTQHPDFAVSLNNLALVLIETGRGEEALPLLYQSLSILKKTLGQNHSLTARTIGILGGLLASKGDTTEGAVLTRQALDILKTISSPNNPQTIHLTTQLAKILFNSNQSEARELLEQALVNAREVYGDDPSQTRDIQQTLDDLTQADQLRQSPA